MIEKILFLVGNLFEFFVVVDLFFHFALVLFVTNKQKKETEQKLHKNRRKRKFGKPSFSRIGDFKKGYFFKKGFPYRISLQIKILDV